jgi:hypothetical protein
MEDIFIMQNYLKEDTISINHTREIVVEAKTGETSLRLLFNGKQRCEINQRNNAFPDFFARIFMVLIFITQHMASIYFYNTPYGQYIFL